MLRESARQKERRITEGHLQPDHVHMLLSIPPKYAVAQVVRYLKGKSAIYLARTYGGRLRNFVGEHFWVRGYFVTTAGRDEEAGRQYLRAQESGGTTVRATGAVQQEEEITALLRGLRV